MKYSLRVKRLRKLTSFALLLLSACETAVDLPEPKHTPQVALTYTLSNQTETEMDYNLLTSRQLYVSNSQRVFDTGRIKGRADAKADIVDANGVVVERFVAAPPRGGGSGPTARYRNEAGYFVPTMGLVGQPGAEYTLRVTVPGLESATSTLQMPALPVIKEAAFLLRPSTDGYATGRFTVTLADEPAVANYYIVSARLEDERGNDAGELYAQTKGPDFSVDQFQLSSPSSYYYYSVYPYPDTNADGNLLTLSTDAVSSRGGTINGTTSFKSGYLIVHVSAITADSYRFYKSFQQYYNTEDNPFAEPTSLISNIKPGYGLFGGTSDATYRVRVN